MSRQVKFLVSVLSFFVVLLFVFVILLMAHVKRTDSITFVDDLTCNYKEEVYADRFIREIDGELLDKYLVDTSVVGKKTVEIQYKNRYGFVEQKRFEVEVKDVVAPTIVVDNPYVVSLGEISNLLDSIFCADDYDDGIKCSISGEYDLNEVGQYSLRISAKDKSGNVTKKNFVLSVVDKKDDIRHDTVTNFSDVYNKYKGEGYQVGVDISKWQGNVDYDKLVNSGVEFVMLKIGGQDGIGGDNVMDPYFLDNINKALEHQLKVGVYFYSYAKNVGEAKKQARWVVQNLRDYNISLPIAFDWENWDRYSNYGIGFRTLNRIASSFLDEVKREKYEGMLYSSKFYLENVWDNNNYKNWIAYYTNHFDYSGEYLMWQLCNDGKIDGIDGFVDIDILKTK